MDNEPTDTNSNDRAFIKIATELRQLENSILVGKAVLKLQARITSAEAIMRQNYSTGDSCSVIAKTCGASLNCTEPYRSYLTFLQGMGSSFTKIESDIETMTARVARLKESFDAYCDGKDVVLTKLASETPAKSSD